MHEHAWTNDTHTGALSFQLVREPSLPSAIQTRLAWHADQLPVDHLMTAYAAALFESVCSVHVTYNRQLDGWTAEQHLAKQNGTVTATNSIQSQLGMGMCDVAPHILLTCCCPLAAVTTSAPDSSTSCLPASSAPAAVAIAVAGAFAAAAAAVAPSMSDGGGVNSSVASTDSPGGSSRASVGRRWLVLPDVASNALLVPFKPLQHISTSTTCALSRSASLPSVPQMLQVQGLFGAVLRPPAGFPGTLLTT